MPNQKKIARVLSIDGGGIRGLIPASIIATWEKTIGPISSQFHMIAGTSTGGILACGLTGPKEPASKLIDFYKKDGPSIFSSTALAGIVNERYPAAPLEQAVREILKEQRLSQVEKDLLLTSYDIENRVPVLFKSWRSQGIESPKSESKINDFYLKDTARATSAAPTYFSPAKIQNIAGQSFALVDGGVFANNPAMCAYVAARRLYPLADEIIVVSIGTGETKVPYLYDDASTWGLIGWARPLLDIMFSGVSDTVSYELDQLAPSVTHYRFQSSLQGASEDMDDASPSNLNALIAVAQRTLDTNKKQVANLLHRLKEPLIDRKELGYPKETPTPKLQAIKKLVIPETPSQAPGMIAGALTGVAVGMALGGPVGAVIGAGLGAAGIKAIPDDEKKT